MPITPLSPQARVHSAPFGQGRFIPVSCRAALAAAGGLPPEDATTLRGLLARHGLPADVQAVERIAARVPDLPATTRRRLKRFFAAPDAPHSRAVLRSTASALRAAWPGLGLDAAVTAAVGEQEEARWRQRSLHPRLLALAGAPAELFCMPPDPATLSALGACWDAAEGRIALAIAAAAELAALGQPWLNRWQAGRPDGLWLWSWRSSDGIGMLNGGNVFTRYVWAVYAVDGVLPAVRAARSVMVSSPPGLALSQPGCAWTFIERSWSPDGERAVTLHRGLDAAEPLWPELRA